MVHLDEGPIIEQDVQPADDAAKAVKLHLEYWVQLNDDRTILF
ncbi:hypothetical protein [Litchfieldella qijiaojingensis]|nr:hypothetical protein [Halomonas qijiaojingensis]